MDPWVKLDILAVLASHGAELPKSTRSGWQAMRCPYHGDTDASASVNVAIGRFNCHACEASGDGHDLIQYHDHVDLATARVIAENMPSCVIARHPAKQKSTLQF